MTLVVEDSESPACSVFTSFTDLEPICREWDEWVSCVGSPIYMTFDWCRTWWEHYGTGHELRVFVFRREEAIVGILPFYLLKLGPRPLGLCVARLVGSNIPPKIFNPPIPADTAAGLFGIALHHLATCGCDLVSIGPLSKGYAALPGLMEAHRHADGLWEAGILSSAGVYTTIELPPTYDAYLRALPKKERYYLKKDESRLFADEVSARVEMVTAPDEVAEEFARFAVQHAAQWAQEGKAGHFGSWPQGLAYNRALVAAQARLGRVRLMRMPTRNGVVARQYIFAFGGSYYWELPARAVGAEWNSFSLGRTAAAQMLRLAIAENVFAIQAGIGHYDYKSRMNASEHAAVTYSAIASNSASRLRAAAYRGWSYLVKMGYHKLWYRRVMPKLPTRWRAPQRRHWLDLDF